MNPQEQLDPQVVNLAKAIRSVETGSQKDPWTARGGSQEYGAYQYTPGTWDKASMKFLGRQVPLEQATREEQNEVTYKQIKEFKDQGLNPGQIASMWNSGKPDAYLDPQYKGVNKYGIKYDVPQYAESVAKAYQSIKGDGEPTITPITASTVGHEQYAEPDKGILGTNKNDSLVDKVLDNSVTRGIQKFFPGAKVGQAIGTLTGLIKAKGKDVLTGSNEAKHYDTSAPTPLQVGGDIAQGALMVGAGMPAAGATTTAGRGLLGATKGFQTAGSTVGRITQNAGIGAGISAGGAIAEGSTDVGEIANQAKTGAIFGGVLGTAGEILNKAASTLPKRFLRSNVTKISDDTAEYAVKKGLGTPSKMLKESEATIDTLSNQLTKELKNEGVTYIQPTGESIIQQINTKFKDAGMSDQEIVNTIKRMVPLKKGLVDKMIRGDITLNELHQLNSAIGKATFKTVFDSPAVKAGKEVGSEAYHVISDILKKQAPKSAPLFDTLSKEIQLRKALIEMTNRVGKHKAFNLRDLISIIAGGSIAGPIGAAGAFVGEKLIASPTANMVAGGLISKFGGSTGVLKPAAMKAVSDISNK